jgi:transposase
MEVVYERCGGLDVHKQRVVACVVVSAPGGPPRKAVRTFGTMTEDLERLAAWLAAEGVTHVAMESTGVFWQPVWNVLEAAPAGFVLLLVNAQHVKAVPGRKTDVKDSEWLADLLRHGLLRASFVPDRAQRELRELTRYRRALLQERAAAVNRLQKTLEGANIKLAAVASDTLGVSGRRMLEALVAGGADAAALADLAKGRLRKKLPELERALTGRFGAHQRFLVAQQLAHVDDLDAAIAALDAEVAARLRPCAAEVARLDAIPGVGQRTAELLVAEVGTDLRRFPTAGHLASWAGMCPGNHESAGKRLSGRTRKGNRYLRAALVEAAQAAARSRHTYLAAQGRRLTVRRGRKRAMLAVGHSILVIVYHLLTRPDAVYQDLGPHYLDRRDREHLERRLVGRLEALGYRVALEPREPTAA